MRFYIALITIYAVLAGISFPAMAACTLNNVSSSGFGSSDGNSDIGSLQVGDISVTCDGEYLVGLDAGVWSAGTRRMSDGSGNYISYQLWQDSVASQEWGEEGLPQVTYPAPALSITGNGTITAHPVYGTVALSGNAPPGDYSDVVKITLAYPPYGSADQVSMDLPITLHITEKCSVETAGVHGFGRWQVNNSNPTGVSLGSVGVVCPSGISYLVGMDAGLFFDGQHRRMSNSIDFVPYTLRVGDSNGPEWGDAGMSAIEPSYIESHFAGAVGSIGTGGNQTFSVWGDALITGSPAGIYKDVVNITVVW